MGINLVAFERLNFVAIAEALLFAPGNAKHKVTVQNNNGR